VPHAERTTNSPTYYIAIYSAYNHAHVTPQRFIRHSVLGLSMRPSVRDHTIEVCEHDRILHTACGNIAEFTNQVQLGTGINWLDFEVKRSKVKVTVRSNMSQKTLWDFEGHSLNVTVRVTDAVSGQRGFGNTRRVGYDAQLIETEIEFSAF